MTVLYARLVATLFTDEVTRYSSSQQASPLRQLTCHMGSRSVNLPASRQRWHSHLYPQPIKASSRFSDPIGVQGWADLVGLVTHLGGIPARRRPPIPALTGRNVEQLRSCDERRYHKAKPPSKGDRFYLYGKISVSYCCVSYSLRSQLVQELLDVIGIAVSSWWSVVVLSLSCAIMRYSRGWSIIDVQGRWRWFVMKKWQLHLWA